MNIPVRSYIRLLSQYMAPQWKRVGLLAFLLLANIGLQLLNPQILRNFIDSAIAQTAPARLTWLAVLYIALGLVYQVTTAGARYVGQNVGWLATNLLRRDVTTHCLGLDMSFHKVHTPGEMIERIDGDVTLLSNFFSQFVIDLSGNLLLLGGIMLLLYREDWRFGVAETLFAVLAMGLLSLVHRYATPLITRQRETEAGFYGFLGEQLSGTEDIRANGAVPFVMARFHERLRTWFGIHLRAGIAGTSMWVVNIITFVVNNAIVFGLGAYLWRRGEITIGTAYLLFTYAELLRRPLDQIRTQMQDLQKAGAGITRVRQLLQTRSRVADGPGAEFPGGPLSVAAQNLSFHYEDDETLVLQGVHVTLAPGKVLGLLGRTGSGKTTLARLLVRLYDPTEGAILVGGVDSRTARLGQLRRRVAMVTQDVQLIRASVRDNLTFFDRSVSDERIITVLEDVGLGAWYRSLPAGLDTELEAGGGGLSAGEAQLLAFSRLFLTDPGLVIMDEASSRLDPATEHLVERAIDKLLHNRTAIIIAHRLATVGRADEILILDGGKVSEYGQREDLAADPSSRFYQLLRTGQEDLLA